MLAARTAASAAPDAGGATAAAASSCSPGAPVFDTINGIPVHPLVVHAVVVLLRLAVLGTIAIAVVPRWRASYGPLVVAAALLATVLIPVATQSGEALQKRVGAAKDHAEMGDLLIWFAIPLLVLVTALWWLARRAAVADSLAEAPTGDAGASDVRRSARSSRLVTGVAALAVVASLAVAFQVYRVGDSGAKSVWEDSVTSTGSGQ